MSQIRYPHPVMARLRDDQRDLLDGLVSAGEAENRTDALRLAVDLLRDRHDHEERHQRHLQDIQQTAAQYILEEHESVRQDIAELRQELTNMRKDLGTLAGAMKAVYSHTKASPGKADIEHLTSVITTMKKSQDTLISVLAETLQEPTP